ncbi:MAG TPA: hypothetical protein DCY27_03480 [Desulfobacterales bacterium]|nr:hypothetical protein [Desulfobacterales bacterium]
MNRLDKPHKGKVRRGFNINQSIPNKIFFIGPMHRHQSLEFALRREVQKPVDIIQSATIRCAELFNLTDQIGVTAPGAYADLLVVDGNPLDLRLLESPERLLSLIMKEGKIFKNQLA